MKAAPGTGRMPELPCLVGFASGSPTCILCFEPTMMFTVPDCPWKLNCGLQYRGITTREPSPKRKERLLRVRPPPCLPSSASLHMSGRGPGDTWKGRGDEASGRAKAKASKSSALSVTPWLTLYLASENAPSGGTNDSTCQTPHTFHATETRAQPILLQSGAGGSKGWSRDEGQSRRRCGRG